MSPLRGCRGECKLHWIRASCIDASWLHTAAICSVEPFAMLSDKIVHVCVCVAWRLGFQLPMRQPLWLKQVVVAREG